MLVPLSLLGVVAFSTLLVEVFNEVSINSVTFLSSESFKPSLSSFTSLFTFSVTLSTISSDKISTSVVGIATLVNLLSIRCFSLITFSVL